MKKQVYRYGAAWLHKLWLKFDYHKSPQARADKLLESLFIHRQLQAFMLDKFSQMEARVFAGWPAYSWLGNDGIDGWILYLLAHAGMGNRTCVELGAYTGADGNTVNLVMNYGFKGYMIDANGTALNYGKQAYSHLKFMPPVFIETFLTRDNIAEICHDHQLPLNPEVLTLDIDSIDLYVLQALPIDPAIIIVEFNNLWGPDESYSVPYHPNFHRELNEFLYGGASLPAFDLLMRTRGYKLVAVAISGFDAIFVKDNPRFDFVPGIGLQQAYENCPAWQQRYLASLNHPVRQKPWVSV
jgi:hypothetical protein